MKKKVLKLFLCAIAVGALYFLLIWVFHEQCRDIARWYTVHKVKENQETLDDAVGQIAEMDTEHITSKKIPEFGIYYKELNNDSVTEAFRKLNLFYIENRIDNQPNGLVTFHPKIDRGLFLNIKALFTPKSVECGFYYSEDDIPIDVFYTREKCEEEFEGEWLWIANYHYQTERIAPNWWYYEVEMARRQKVYLVSNNGQSGIYFCTFTGVMESAAGYVFLTDRKFDVSMNNDIVLQKQYGKGWYYCGTD